MSDNNPLVDLEQMLLPAWAKQASSQNRFEHFTGEEGDRPRRGGGGGGGGGFRRRDEGRPRDRGARPDRGGERGDRGARPNRPPGAGPDRRFPGRGGRREDDRRPVAREEIKLPDVKVALAVDEKVADSLALQKILAGKDRLTEALLPQLGLLIRDLFAAEPAPPAPQD